MHFTRATFEPYSTSYISHLQYKLIDFIHSMVLSSVCELTANMDSCIQIHKFHAQLAYIAAMMDILELFPYIHAV